jgi:hypothetical protein
MHKPSQNFYESCRAAKPAVFIRSGDVYSHMLKNFDLAWWIPSGISAFGDRNQLANATINQLKVRIFE